MCSGKHGRRGACRVTLKLGPRYEMGDLEPKQEDGWKRTLKGHDWAVWEKDC